QFQIAGYDGPVQGLWQLLPLEEGQVATSTDLDGVERPLPPDVAGIYWDRALDANNIPAQRRYRGRFSLDAERGIGRFAEPVLQVNSAGTPFGGAQLSLTVAHGITDLATLQEFRRTCGRDLPGEPNGTGPQIVRRDDLVQTVVTQYDSGNNPTGTTDNASDF